MFGNKLLGVAALIAGLLLPAQAMAAYEAYTRVDLNLRVGPDTTYGVIDVIPQGDPVVVLGCIEGVEWCDIEWFGLRGWVAAYFLVQPGTAIYLPQLAPRIGLPIISFSFSTYHDRHYRDRPWYKKRHGRWRGRDWRRGDRPKHRQETQRPKQREEARRPRQRQEIERPRQRQETQRPRQRQETRRPRQRQEIERPRQRQETRRPRQREETQRPRRQRTERSLQRQEAHRPRQRERSRQRSERPRQGQRQGRSRSDEKERLRHRGQ